ncbi:hypothetical protein DXG03_001977 [Asterophora parasitica]|uniref:Uncharacterized protein n=1 Tax=Asterophora parasitica TaxID=117018 RepID=A0A9P7KCI1_9AGAR|nr:hypothetical protein DXG03_001977 [Asterophora parasitica]
MVVGREGQIAQSYIPLIMPISTPIVKAHPIRELVETILSGIEALETAHSTHGMPYPSLDDPSRVATVLDGDEEVDNATHLIVTAATQLIAFVRKPSETLQNYALSFYLTTSLGFAVESNAADILKDSGPQVCFLLMDSDPGLLTFIPRVPGPPHEGYICYQWCRTCCNE